MPEPTSEIPAVATHPFTNEDTESYKLVAAAKDWLASLEPKAGGGDVRPA